LKPKPKRALVTGGAGFIGSHIVDALIRRGIEVCVVDDMSTGDVANIQQHVGNPMFNLIEADIRRINKTRGIPQRLDVVFHEAAIASVPKSVDDPMLVHDVNVNGSLQVMSFCAQRKVKRFVFASSAAVYGAVTRPPAKEEDLCAPGSPYGASKLAVENYMHAYRSTYGLETVALRYFNVYGPRQKMNDDYSGVIPLFARQILQGEKPTVFGDGLQTRDFVNVADIARANLLAMEAESAPGQVFNIASGRQVTILRLLEALCTSTGNEQVRPSFAPARRGDLRVGAASISRAEEVLGYAPKVELEDGLGEVARFVGTKLGVGAMIA
jgi:nucleoside-diphosphate-sugar epimerase